MWHLITALPLVLILLAPPQSDGRALVYMYRQEEASRLLSGSKPTVYLDGKPMLSLPERSFVGIRLRAGRYTLRTNSKRTETLLRVEEGKTYFVRISRAGSGDTGLRDAIYFEAGEQAAFQIEKMRALEDKNIKDKALEVVRDKPAQ